MVVGGNGRADAGGEVAAGGVNEAGGAVDAPILEWGDPVDRFSFEDSDRFEEDSLCSWSSEAESLINNWRGWRRPPAGYGASKKSTEGEFLRSMFLCHNSKSYQ